MPELPEVETIRRDLEQRIIHKKIVGFYASDTKVLQGANKKIFCDKMEGAVFKRIDRRGKMLIFKLDSGYYLLAHLKMTGQLVYAAGNDLVAGGHEMGEIGKLPNKHTRAIVEFEDGSKLFFNDQRRFGYLKMASDDELKRLIQYFGTEPLSEEFTLACFQKIFRNRTTAIKNLLMNQNLIAGIGNIYADEICFEARVRPDRPAPTLSDAEKKRLHQTIQKILKKAIDYRGTTFASYRDSSGQKGNFSRQLKVYGRAGENCSRCGTGVIVKIKVGQRGTHYCPICQG